MWSPETRLTLARQLTLQPIRHLTNAIPLALSQRRQTRSLSSSSRTQNFLDSKKFYAWTDRLAKKPLPDSLFLRTFSINLIEGAAAMKKGMDVMEKDQQSRGVSKDGSENSTRWAFTGAVLTLLLSQVGLDMF